MRPRQVSVSVGSDSGSEYVVLSDTESDDTGPETCEPELDGNTEVCSEVDVPDFADSREAQEIRGQIRGFGDNPSELVLDDYDDEESLFDGNRYPVEHYRKGLKEMDESAYDRKEYAEKTELSIEGTHRRWSQFCTKVLQIDPLAAYRVVNFRVVYHFLDWHLNQRTSPSGRRTKGIKSKSSLITFWCLFRLAFERARVHKIDKVIDGQRLSNALVELGQKHGLSSEKRENREMTIADLKAQLDCVLRTTEKSFKLGEVRLLFILYLLLLAPAGSRPASILQLRFGDIQLVLARDPKNGPHKLLIEFTLNFTKRYLGQKAIKTFLIPEIIYDPYLLLSPHAFLLGILFHHRAFRSDVLNNNHRSLADLNIVDGEYELPIPLKQELDDVFVFRRTLEGPMGPSMAQAPISQGMITDWFNRIGELSGFDHSTILYSLRYGAGNRMDRNTNVSEALRNLVMDHAPNSDTFQKHYLCRNVCIDLWAINRGDDPQRELVEQATSHGHSRSIRRPVNLTAEQSASIASHPKMIQLEDRIQKLRPHSIERANLRKEIKALRSVLFRSKKKEVREKWRLDQAVQDIDYQLLTGHLPKASETRHKRPMGPFQQRLVQALTEPLAGIDLGTQFERRHKAIDAIMAYCTVEEPVTTKVLEARAPPPPPELQSPKVVRPMEVGPGPLDHDKLRRSVFVQTPGERLGRCFICVSKALTKEPEDNEIHVLCRTFSTFGGVTRHFRSVHLNKYRDEEKFLCPLCGPAVKLRNKAQLQYHADVVHGIRTDFTLP